MSSLEARAAAAAGPRSGRGVPRGRAEATPIPRLRVRDRLPREFFARPTLEVARDLVGRVLAVPCSEGLCAVRLVEVEAYLGVGLDPASHAHRGPTPRSRVMFATPGGLYVYFIYGMHHCMNVVCEPEGVAGAVLLRAAEPLAGLGEMERRRGVAGTSALSGPGRLCQALGIDRSWDGSDLVTGPIGLWPGRPPRELGVSGRIGIRAAADRPYRFFDPDSRYVSQRSSGAVL